MGSPFAIAALAVVRRVHLVGHDRFISTDARGLAQRVVDTILPAWSATLKMVKHTAIDPERNEFFRSGNARPRVGGRRCFRNGRLEQCLGLVPGAGGPASSVAVHGASLSLVAVSAGVALSSKRLGQALAFTRRGLLAIAPLPTAVAAFRPRPIDLAKAERASE